jgi:coenzyme F420-reducing hydrogenase delta subunit
MISLQHLLAAFAAGARQVMVLACHEDNCHSEIGNQRARMRIEQLRTHLAAMGMAPDRLQFHTLAANMAKEFTDLVRRAAEMD